MSSAFRDRSPDSAASLAAVLSKQCGVLVEQTKRFVERLRRQEQRHLIESEVFDGAPIFEVRGSTELRQRDIVAGAVTHLTDALTQVLRGQRVGEPARVVSDHPLDGGIGVAADKDRRMRLLYRLRTTE